MCHIVPICNFFGGLKGFLIHFVSHHSYLCGVEFITHARIELNMGLIPLLNRMLRKNWTSSSTANREYAKIRKLQLRILLMQKFMS
jgi:hypothetical protein